MVEKRKNGKLWVAAHLTGDLAKQVAKLNRTTKLGYAPIIRNALISYVKAQASA